MRHVARRALALLVVAVLGSMTWSTSSTAQQGAAAARQTVRVGTKQAPPFAIKNPDGTWRGISIELWQAIARDLRLDYELREMSLQELLAGVQDGSLDVAVAALTITAGREERFDFSHAFHTTGLGIAVRQRADYAWLGVLKRLLSWEFVEALFGLVALLGLVGGLMWLCERRRNAAQFDTRPAPGIGAGLWWAAVTMTTVGYGDKAPQTFAGRILGLIWMFAAIVMISGFTAAITTALTITELGTAIRGPEELANVRIGTTAASTSAEYLQGRRAEASLQALLGDHVDAVVYDAPLLRYLASTVLRGKVEVLRATFERQDYGIAMPGGSALREPINQSLLATIQQPQWQDVLYRYVGR